MLLLLMVTKKLESSPQLIVFFCSISSANEVVDDTLLYTGSLNFRPSSNLKKIDMMCERFARYEWLIIALLSN